MKFNFTEPKKIDNLLEEMGSRDKNISMSAQYSFAAFIAPAVSQVLNQAATSTSVYREQSYRLGEIPTVPVELFFGNKEGLMKVWSNQVPGGLAYNEIIGTDEYRVQTYKLSSAIALQKSYAQGARLDVVAKAIEKLTQEILVLQEWQAWNVALAALAGATTEGSTHLVASNAKLTSAARNLIPDDLNRLITKAGLLRKSWVGGTPVSMPGRGVTDVFMSFLAMEKVRAWGYNPVNTTAVPDTSESTVLALPDAMRMQIFNSGGMGSFWGINFHVLNEFGLGGAYNSLFDNYYSGSPTFSSATEELVLGIDRTADALIRVIATDSDTGSTFTLYPDDQFPERQQKIGWYGELEEGRIVTDVKALTGIIW